MIKARTISPREFLLPVVLLLMFGFASLHQEEILMALAHRGFGSWQRALEVGLQIGLWLASAYFIFSVIRVIVLEGVVAEILGGPAPHLLRDVLGLFLFALAVTGITRFVFGQQITAFWATSGAVGIVIGLALRPVILDMFSGLTINLDRSYRIGDWINLEGEREGKVSGEVVEINLRATQIKTVEGNLVIVPNSRMGMGILTNFTLPVPRHRMTVTICLDYSIPVERVRRILLAGVRSMTHPKGPLAEPAPDVLVEGTSDLGVVYRVDYWQLDHCGPREARSRVYEGMLRHLHAAGVTPAYPKRDNYTAPMPSRQFDGRTLADRITLMRRVALFAPLPEATLEVLASGLVPRMFAAGDTLVRHGAAGESMFVLVEGLLEVRTVLVSDGADEAVAVLQPGEFLGEMSLLTGEPRSATVVALTDAMTWEITKEQMEPVLRSDPALAQVLARTLAARQASNALARDRSRAPTHEQTEHRSREILHRIMVAFRHVYESLSHPPFLTGSRPAASGDPTKHET